MINALQCRDNYFKAYEMPVRVAATLKSGETPLFQHLRFILISKFLDCAETRYDDSEDCNNMFVAISELFVHI